jgi:DUF4097 and DUF4098 domain-containing protein YvlB
MSRLMLLTAFAVAFAGPDGAFATETSGTREFKAAAGGKLTLNLDSGGSVKVSGTGGSSVTITYKLSCSPDCEINFDQSGSDVRVETRFKGSGRNHDSDGDFDIRVPSRFDVALDSMGGSLEIDGVTGSFTGETKGGEITLHHVEGDAKLSTMGGEIRVTESTLDGSVHTMGGAVTIENVSGDLKGSSMGGGVRYKNVRRADGRLASPPRTGDGDSSDLTQDTVQISTMGGEINTEDAPDGADVMTMGGDITIKSAKRFVRAKTMGGDIEIDSVDGWVQATTMGGNLDVTVTGGGGDVTLTSMGGTVVLNVPRGFGMDLDLEIAFTKNSRKEYTITAPGAGSTSVSPDWDYDKGSPRKYIRKSGAVNGGGHKVTVRTINGNVTVNER